MASCHSSACISVLAGVLVAYGAFAVLAALVGAAATAILLAIVLIAAVSAIIASQVDADTIRTNLRSLGIPTLGSEWSDIGTLATTTMPTPSPHPGPTSGIRLARTAPSTTARTAAEQAVSTRRSGAPSCAHE